MPLVRSTLLGRLFQGDVAMTVSTQLAQYEVGQMMWLDAANPEEEDNCASGYPPSFLRCRYREAPVAERVRNTRCEECLMRRA